MDLFSIVVVTAAVLGVLLLVLAIIALVVLLPPVRRALAERAHKSEAESAPDVSETHVEGAVADPEAASSDRAEPEQR